MTRPDPRWEHSENTVRHRRGHGLCLHRKKAPALGHMCVCRRGRGCSQLEKSTGTEIPEGTDHCRAYEWRLTEGHSLAPVEGCLGFFSRDGGP